MEISEADLEDPFVGDKISPDLRELMANKSADEKVEVILQADDINNAQLRNLLQNNNVSITSEASNLNMLTLEMPVGLAEQISQVRGSRHLSDSAAFLHF